MVIFGMLLELMILMEYQRLVSEYHYLDSELFQLPSQLEFYYSPKIG